jgi:peptidoglycan hydrolase-like protein with peptidoglycan-binding domain
MHARELQQALKDRGFTPGDIDGVIGRNTIAAIRAFQAANGLDVDGIAGRNTIAALRAGRPADSDEFDEVTEGAGADDFA